MAGGERAAPNEADERFPSGAWEGYFLQRRVSAAKGRMELDLTFRDGRITGGGRDGVGAFEVAGRYETADGICSWTKRYRTHAVRYRGFAEGKGIWGTWEIPPIDRDGFHIWPKGRGAGEGWSERREEAPAAAVEEVVPEAEPVGAA